MAKIKIIITNNNKAQLTGDLKTLMQMDKDPMFAVKHPNAFFLRRHMQAGWDGKIHYITDRGYFKLGLLDNVVKWLKENNHKIKIQDERPSLPMGTVPEKIGNLKPRPYQAKAIKAVIDNTVLGMPHRVGVINAATNAGKTMICAGIYKAFDRELKALVLINDSDLYEQFREEIPKLVGDDYGCVRGKEKEWNNFTIAMVQTLSRNVRYFQKELYQYDIVLVDEADLADNKTYKTVLQHCINAQIKIGLSGSIYVSNLAKHRVKNENLRAFFGNEIFNISKKEMVDKGHSTNMVIKIIPGSTMPALKGDFQTEYRTNITQNSARHRLCAERMEWNIKYDRLPAIVICQFHEHIENMLKEFKSYFGDKYIIEAVHGGYDTKVRKDILTRFRDGKIDILICSYIIKRGKNFPLLRYLMNASSSDSQENIIQIMGRLERKHESKSKAYLDDIYDEGHYLRRHAKHRKQYYLKQKFKVIDLVNPKTIKTKKR